MNLNSAVLAYLGDAVYELYIRNKLIEKNIVKIEELNKEAINYVSANNQSKILNILIEKNILTEQEIEIVKHARNNKRTYHPKNTDIITYKYATGFEALIGYLYLEDKDRLEEILKNIEV